MNDSKKTRELLNYDSSNRFYDITGISPCLNTMQGGGRQPKVAIPVMTPDRPTKKQNGRRFKDEGDAMFTLTTADRHGILIKEATKKGYAEAVPGDSVNLTQPNSKTRRGRVGKGIANTLLTGEAQAVVTEKYQIRRLTPLECFRLQGFPDKAFLSAKFGDAAIAEEILKNGLNHYDCEFEQVVSDSQLYKQAGNSVTVPVVYDIARRLK